MLSAPEDADVRRAIPPVICYPTETLPAPDMSLYTAAREAVTAVDDVIVPPRDAAAIIVPAGHFLRIHSIDGPQVGDLNLFNVHDLTERFYSGKTRALHGSHVTRGGSVVVIVSQLAPDGHRDIRHAAVVRDR